MSIQWSIGKDMGVVCLDVCSVCSVCGPQGYYLFVAACFIDIGTYAHTETDAQLDRFLAQHRQSHNSYFLRVALVSKEFC